MSEHLSIPTIKPNLPHFSSGPCAKRPGWSVEKLANACVGRSHRSTDGKAKLAEVIERSKKILGVPSDYRLVLFLLPIQAQWKWQCGHCWESFPWTSWRGKVLVRNG